MPNMQWLWRRVCSSSCTTACKIYCPGCRAMAGEWETQGYGSDTDPQARTPVVTARLRAALRRFVELARCGVDCLVTELRSRLRNRQEIPPARELYQGGGVEQTCQCRGPSRPMDLSASVPGASQPSDT